MTANQLFYRKVAKEFFLLLGILALCRLSGGLAAYAVAAWGCFSALRGKPARAFACLATLSLLTNLNPFFIPAKSRLLAYALRGGSFFILGLLVLGCGQRKGPYRLPLGMLFAYLGVCAISSATGWLPIVSYMKLVLFSVLLMAVIVGGGALQASAEELQLTRCFFIALAAFLAIGSLAIWPFPQYSSLGAIRTMRLSGGDFGAVEALVSRDMSLNRTLLCGVLNHSQTLGAVGSGALAFVVADMLYIEKRISGIHTVLIYLLVFTLYLTRSRTALAAMAATFLFVVWRASQKVQMSPYFRSKVKKAILQVMLLFLVVGVIAEIRNETLSKWVRKKNNVAGDDRSIVTAISETRQRLIAKSMRDFYLNPILGMGFQVEERHRYHIKGYGGSGLILSASIEKGLLPLMVLGETGIIGSIVFILFLANFYSACARGKLVATGALFTVFLAANMGEATFFSIGGSGGMQWMFLVVGGFSTDMLNFMQQRYIGPITPRAARHA